MPLDTRSPPGDETRATILAIAGSLRKGSYNRMLLLAAMESAPPGLNILMYEGFADIPVFDEDLEASTNGGPLPVKALRRQIASVDGVLIATPEYNQGFPGAVKNLIDWLSRDGHDGLGEVLTDKPVAICGATVGAWGTRLAQMDLRRALLAAGAWVMPRPSLYLRSAVDKFDRNGRLTDEQDKAAVTGLLNAYSIWLSEIRKSTVN